MLPLCHRRREGAERLEYGTFRVRTVPQFIRSVGTRIGALLRRRRRRGRSQGSFSRQREYRQANLGMIYSGLCIFGQGSPVASVFSKTDARSKPATLFVNPRVRSPVEDPPVQSEFEIRPENLVVFQRI